MLEQEQLDVLYVCIPPFCHGDIEEQARKGIHLMVEKPLGLDVQSVRHKAKVISESGIIALPATVCATWTPLRSPKIFLRTKIGMVRAHYITTPVPTPWWRKKALSGGLVEQSTHTMDLVRYLCGDITRLYADMKRAGE